MRGAPFVVLLLLVPTASFAQAPLDFATFVDLVARNHPEVAAAQLTVERSRQAEARAGVLADPEIAVTRQYVPIPGASRAVDASSNPPMSQLTLTQTLPWPGTVTAQQSAARAATDSAGTDEKMAAILRRLAAEELFIDMVRLAEAADFERTSVADADSILKSSAARLRNAVGSHHELVQAQNERAVHTLNLAALEADLQNLQDHAAQTLGLDSADKLAFVLRLPAAYTGSPRPPASVPLDLTRLRRQQEEDEAAARFAAERTQSLPHLTAAGMVMRQDDGMRSVGVMAGISIPVFSGRSRRSFDEERAASSSQTRLDLAWHDRKKSLAQTQNLRRLAVLSQTLTVLKDEIVPNAKQHLRALLSDYALGRASFAAASNAREQLLQFEFAEATARQAYARAMVAQERILVGFVDDALDQPIPQVLSNMGGQGAAAMGSPAGPTRLKGIGAPGSPARDPSHGATMSPAEEPSASSGGMGGL